MNSKKKKLYGKGLALNFDFLIQMKKFIRLTVHVLQLAKKSNI
jgi:hypothetical protein